ncbi:hypothetical protein Tco_0365854 [Tanacetum coccineum]
MRTTVWSINADHKCAGPRFGEKAPQLNGPELSENHGKRCPDQAKDATAHDRQKSYADRKRKPMDVRSWKSEFAQGLTWKGVVRYESNPTLFSMYSNLKKCYCRMKPISHALEGIHVDVKLQFVRER